jgi:cell division protease FtsH
LFILFLWFFIYRGAQGGSRLFSFGKSRARLFAEEKDKRITFEDVAGVDEAKEELREAIEFLKDPKKFQRLGGKMPKGILLIGPPGTGKTLLAKAVAGEAGVPFLSISGSDFVEMFVGVGASRVRDLFDTAKRSVKQSGKGCIIFLDEIDAVGRQRFAGIGGGHDEREQTLNALLVEMDGFDTQEGIILVSATNRPDVLDPALLRPGRFDRIIVVDRPDINGREAILRVHVKKIKLDKDVDLKTIARRTPGFSGADLANLVNEAALLAARRGKEVVGLHEVFEASERVMAGPEKKSRVISPYEKKITAYHEAGHALVNLLIPEADPLHKVTIIPRGMALGYTMHLPVEDRYIKTRKELLVTLAIILGGRVSEELIFEEKSTGAQDDLDKATELARSMVCEYGMSDKLGPRTFGDKQELVFLGREISEQRDYGEKVADIIDEEMNKLIVDAHERARQILTDNKEKLIQLGEILYEKETLEGEELEALLNQPADSSTAESTETPPAGDITPPAKPMGQKPRTVPQLNPKQLPATD